MQARYSPDTTCRPLWLYRLQMGLLWLAVAGLVGCLCWFAQVAATL